MSVSGNLTRSLAAISGAVSDDIPFWGCGLLGQLHGISDGTAHGDMKRMIDGLKVANPYGKVHFWNWNLAPMNPKDGGKENLTSDFIFMPEQWGTNTVEGKYVREANTVGFLDSEGEWCPAQMADIFLGANEPDIHGSCMGSMMGSCKAPCTPAEVAAGDCPIAHLNSDQGSASPNSKGHCDCWSDSHATGCGYWPVNGVDNEQQPLPTCWDNPQCVTAVMNQWRDTAKIVTAKGYKYLTTPLVAVNMDYMRSFLKHACDGCSDISCGCPTHIGWHFYANDCLSQGMSGYDNYQEKLDKTVELMEEFPFLLGAIVNEVGMLNCDMSTPAAICEPDGASMVYPAKDQPNHACPSTPTLPNGFATFIEHLIQLASKSYTSDGRRAVAAFTWFNLDMAGGTYNLRMFNDDGSMNAAGEAYIKSCQAWASGGPMPGPVPVPRPTPTPAPSPAPVPTPVPTPAPSSSCNVGDPVPCPGYAGAFCAGDQCCPDSSTCPSANPGFNKCSSGKTQDCTGMGLMLL